MLQKIIRAFAGGDSGNGHGKSLPAVDYSGEPTDADIEAIRKAHASEVKSGNLKTVDGPAW